MKRPSLLNSLLFGAPRDFVNRRVFQTAQRFMQIEAASGIAMLAAALTALIWANSPWDHEYFELWHTEISVHAELVSIDLDLREWVNDGLMTIFFFLMGLEIKREMVHGELSSTRRALLPAAAAMGGMAAPALIYTVFNAGGEGAKGWGVPMATDIAFALGVLSLLSRRVPFSIKVFLLALAVADDIGAIMVIAVFYTTDLNLTALGIAAATLAFTFALNRSGVRTINIYIAVGAVLWLAMLESGVHATIAGVILGLLAPASYFYNPAGFADAAEDLVQRFRLAQQTGNLDVQQSLLAQIEDLAQGSEPPLDRLERALHPWVSFAIVPVFALANAGVAISGDVLDSAVQSPVSQGVALGLLFGKPTGIFLMTWLAVKLRICDMPTGANWLHVLGVGILGGIGFTVALLITDLGFEQPLLVDEAKLGVLSASVVAGFIGFVFLWLVSSPVRHESTEEAPQRGHLSSAAERQLP